MFGEKLYPTTIICGICGLAITVMADGEDVKRYSEEDLEAAVAFASRDGLPYLNPVERELFVSGVCITCWRKLDENLEATCE